MLFDALIFVLGVVVCYLVLAWRQSQPGDTMGGALRRPFSGGGPRPGRPR